MAFRRNFAFRLAAELLSKVLAMGVTLVLARQLGPEAWGGMQWALAGAGLFGVLADFGLGSLVTRELAVAKEKEKRGWLLAAWQLKGLLWLLALGLFAAFQAVSNGDKATLLLPAALLTVALSLGEFNSALYAGYERLDLDLLWGFLAKLGQALLVVFALYAGWGARGVLYSMAAAAWLGWVLNFWRLWSLGQATSSKALGLAPKRRVLLQGLWPFGLVSVLTLIYVKADNLLLEHLSGLPAVGIYQSAYKWFEAVAFVPTAFIAAAFPSMARSEKEADGAAKRLKAFRAMGALGATAAAGLFALAALLPRLLGPAYDAAPDLLRALSGGCLLLFPNYILFTLLVASRRQSLILVGVLLAVIFNLGGNLWLMPRYGALGASWMTVGTEGVIFLSALVSLRASLAWQYALGAFAQSALAAGLACAVAWALLGLGTLPALIVALFVAPLLAFALSLWWGLMPMDEIRRLARRALQGKTPA